MLLECSLKTNNSEDCSFRKSLNSSFLIYEKSYLHTDDITSLIFCFHRKDSELSKVFEGTTSSSQKSTSHHRIYTYFYDIPWELTVHFRIFFLWFSTTVTWNIPTMGQLIVSVSESVACSSFSSYFFFLHDDETWKFKLVSREETFSKYCLLFPNMKPFSSFFNSFTVP